MYFFTSNNLITNSQFGFLPNNSTVDALNSFIEFQYNALNYSQYALNVFVDLSKAFDTIDHQILLGKLDKYGVRGLPLKLIKSYIIDCKYKVSIDENISNVSTSNIGTAQGSILAPLLFIIYMNDLPNYLPNSFTILYADDTTLCYKNNSLMSAIEQCNSELLKFSLWCQANKLTINLDKTCYMIVSNRKIPDLNVSLKMNNIPINLTHSHKFLGVTFDDQLKFNLHIADISTKISKSVGIIYKLSNILPNSTLLNIYHALVNSHIMYCNVIWGGTHDIHIKPLVLLQKKCLRIVNKTNFFAHTHPLFISNRVLKYKDIHKYSQLCFIHKNLDSFSPLITSHNYSTRNYNTLNSQYQRLALCQRSISYSGINNFNFC